MGKLVISEKQLEDLVSKLKLKINEGGDPENTRYMFFSNLEQLRRQSDLLLEIDKDIINDILENGHDWAQDHVAEAKNNMDQVFDFLMNETKRGDGDNMIIDNELNEGFLGDLGSDIASFKFGNIGAGIRGMFSGEGYKLARQINVIKNSVEKLDRMRNKLSDIMSHLRHVHVDLTELKSNDPYVARMAGNLESVVKHYSALRTSADNLSNGVNSYFKQQEALKQQKQQQKQQKP